MYRRLKITDVDFKVKVSTRLLVNDNTIRSISPLKKLSNILYYIHDRWSQMKLLGQLM